VARELDLEDVKSGEDEAGRTVRMTAGATPSHLGRPGPQPGKIVGLGLEPGDPLKSLRDGAQPEDAGAALLCALLAEERRDRGCDPHSAVAVVKQADHSASQ